MTIDRRGFLAASSSALVLGKQGLSLTMLEPPETPEPPPFEAGQAREVTVYTTADKTDQRLSATGKLTFKPMGQPLETQICVFVDPTKRFQTILGIGGALTDASAETFAKLPPAKQREILDAYFDPAKGIAGVIMMQYLPFADAKALATYDTFERGAYQLVSAER